MRRTVIIGIISSLVVLGAGVLAGQSVWSSPSTSTPLAAMIQADKAAQKQFLTRLAQRYPRLAASHGVITPQDVDLTAQQAHTPKILHPNQITGVETAWHHTASYLRTQSQHLHLESISPQVWQAGFRTGASDVMMAAGNDPLQAVMTAGPATAAKFWQLEQAVYAGSQGQMVQLHWVAGMEAQPRPYPQGPSFKIYPIIHEVPGTPDPLVLLRVPVILSKVEVMPQAHHQFAVRTAMQTGAVILALTHTGSRWQWWTEQLVLHAATIYPSATK